MQRAQLLLAVLMLLELPSLQGQIMTPRAGKYCVGSLCSYLAVNCGDPGNPLFGSRVTNGFTYMFTIHFWCDPGYLMLGSAYRTCNQDGAYLSPPGRLLIRPLSSYLCLRQLERDTTGVCVSKLR